MNFATALIVLLQAVDPTATTNGSPEAADSGLGFTIPFEIVAIAVGVLVTFGLVYLVKRALGDGHVE